MRDIIVRRPRPARPGGQLFSWLQRLYGVFCLPSAVENTQVFIKQMSLSRFGSCGVLPALLFPGNTALASSYFVPEQVYPWLGLISGLLIAGLGVFLFLQRWSGQSFYHDHSEGAKHSHWFIRIDTTETPEQFSGTRQVTLKHLLVLLMSQFRGKSQLFEKWLPLTSATFITVLGCVLAERGLSATHVLRELSPRGAGWGAFVLTVLVGFVLGVRHSTDPDHIVAVSTIVSRDRSLRNGAMIGAVWGIGHTLTIFIVGSAIILFRITIPPRIGLGMEFLVALMLILLGLLNLTGLLPRLRARFSNAAPDAELRGALTGTSRRILLRSLAVGIVHGLAGSAAVALLVLATIQSPGWAICYLLVFGIGTIAGMMLMTSAISLPLTRRKFENAGSYLSVCAGLVSLAFGAFLVYQIGYVSGLFAANPIWTPR